MAVRVNKRVYCEGIDDRSDYSVCQLAVIRTLLSSAAELHALVRALLLLPA